MTRLPPLLLLLASACGGDVEAREAPRPASVLLVAVDGLRADQLGARGPAGPVTPQLDRLARRGLVYEDASTPAPWNAPALAALLSGCYPSSLGWTDLDRPLPYGVTLLAEHLDAAGHATGAVVNHRFVAAPRNLDQGFDVFREVGLPPEEAGDEHVAPPSAHRVTEAALAILDGFGERPFLLLVHHADPLPPWSAPAPFDADYVGPVEAGLSLRELLRIAPELNDADRNRLRDLHDASVTRVDAEVGRLLAGLEARGRAGDTYVSVVSTSGVELGEHGELGTAMRLYDELLHVPWILVGPRLAPDRFPGPTSLIDVAPTLLELVGCAPLPRADGVAALPGMEAGDRVLFSETDRARRLRAVVDRRWKLIRDEETGVRELYDLVDDPREARDLARRLPERVEALEAALEGWEAGLAAE